MPRSESIAPAAGRASLIAGPAYLLFSCLFMIASTAGQAWDVQLGSALAAALVLLLSVVIGSIVAFPVCLIAGAALAFAAEITPFVRHRTFWVAFAVALAALILLGLDAFFWLEVSVPFVATAALCAWIVRAPLCWD